MVTHGRIPPLPSCAGPPRETGFFGAAFFGAARFGAPRAIIETAARLWLTWDRLAAAGEKAETLLAQGGKLGRSNERGTSVSGRSITNGSACQGRQSFGSSVVPRKAEGDEESTNPVTSMAGIGEAR